MYAALGMHPDIAYAVPTLSHYSAKFGPIHWEATKRIFCYLSGAKGLWLTHGCTKIELIGYVDADSSMAEDRHTISGYTFILNGGAVSWSVKHQKIILLSTTETEYVAAAHAAKEALWFCSLIKQLHEVKLSPTTMFSNNQSTIALAKDHYYHAQTKNINVHYHFIWWIVKNEKMSLFVWFIVLLRTWWRTTSPKPHHQQKSSILL